MDTRNNAIENQTRLMSAKRLVSDTIRGWSGGGHNAREIEILKAVFSPALAKKK